jgi:hypothetical protein
MTLSFSLTIELCFFFLSFCLCCFVHILGFATNGLKRKSLFLGENNLIYQSVKYLYMLVLMVLTSRLALLGLLHFVNDLCGLCLALRQGCAVLPSSLTVQLILSTNEWPSKNDSQNLIVLIRSSYNSFCW